MTEVQPYHSSDAASHISTCNNTYFLSSRFNAIFSRFS